MSSRLKHVATVNEEIAHRGGYQTETGTQVSISARLSAARSGTVSYPPEEPNAPLPAPPGPHAGVIAVTAEGSMQAAHRLHFGGAEHVAVLNFASARNPGGGYLRGARAQEEDLCRTALLYRCLLEAPDFYAAHRVADDLRYSHRVIFSPGVPVIRDERGGLLAEPYGVSFLTSPAPNAGELLRRSASVDVAAVLAERAVRVLAVAARHGVRELVLGAWGCGVFRNDPAEVAAAFHLALEQHGAAFDQVVFAVWDRTPVSVNRAAFEARFAR
jgi:uncharacterized protein (TIGR02452 family)